MCRAKFQIIRLEKDDTHLHSIVKASVAGLPVRAVLDTGASRTCLDLSFVSASLPQLLESSQSVENMCAGFGGMVSDTRFVDVPDFKLGRFRLALYPAVVLLDMQHVNAVYKMCGKPEVQMILGNDFFVVHKALIDYNSRFLIFER